MIALRLLLLIVVLGLAACDVVEPFLRMAEGEMSRGETVTYRDERYNYELDYPAEWRVVEYSDMTMLFSYEEDALPAGHYFPPGTTKIDIHPSELINATPFLDYVTGRLQDMQPDACLGYDDPIVYRLDGGGLAVEAMLYSDMAAYNVAYVDLEGRYFVFAAFGDPAPLRDIVRSLRPITPTGSIESQPAFTEIHVERHEDCYLP
jgi:hypothetical protein